MTDEADVHAYYGSGAELDRLDRALGIVEFERTKEIVDRHLPPAPAVVTDVGGGPGRYALWLAERGYEVRHRDLIPLHVERTLEAASAARLTIDARVADARALDLADGSADAVLLLGPLYHLTARADRVRALAEASRVVRPGGVVFAAAISRWAPRLHGVLVDRIHEEVPAALELLGDVERTGVLSPLSEGSFAGFCHRPDELREEAEEAGLNVVDLVGVEGLSFALGDLEERLASEESRRIVLDATRAIERVPELLGLGPHVLLTARVQ
jgi:SAM-dependent methyltransferase